MEIFVVVLLGFAVIGLISCAWGAFCNEQTYRQRTSILNKIRDSGYSLGWDGYNAVDYNTHMWRLFFLRDPSKLYPPELNWKN